MTNKQLKRTFELFLSKLSTESDCGRFKIQRILVAILFDDNDRHSLPHLHVRYSGQKTSIAIEDGCVLAGAIPPKQLKMLLAWIEIHKDELFADWELALAGEQPLRIALLQ